MKRAGLLATYVKPYLPPRVLAFGLRVAGPVFSLIWQGRRTLWLRRTIRKIEPDAVLSFLTQTNILTVLATRGLDYAHRHLRAQRSTPAAASCPGSNGFATSSIRGPTW